ncbi:MAG: hypothetical protein AAF773_17880 [Cyanobacteria bacterium P01_D01_bin.115]
MKFAKSLSLLSLTVLLVAAFAPIAAANQAVLVIRRGQVRVQRNGRNTFRSARNGLRLGGTDLIRTNRGTTALLNCAGRATLVPIPANSTRSVNSLCNRGRYTYRPGVELEVGDLQGGSDPTIPFVITPRSSAITSTQPTIRWNPVADASQYTVRLEVRERRSQLEPDAVLWQIETDQSAIAYPDSPPLQSRLFYTVVVEADTGQSSLDETVAAQSFVVRPGDAVQGQVDQIDDLELPPALAAQSKADIYVAEGFIPEAIMILHLLVDADEATAGVYQQLGDLYLASGLRLPAEAAYQQAIATADFYTELEDWMLAHIGLALLSAETEAPGQAIQYLRRAEVAAFYFCDAELIAQIQAEIAELMPEPELDDTEAEDFALPISEPVLCATPDEMPADG